jgi:hypothetical protein
MVRTLESLQTINSLLRTVIALAVVGGLGTAGWLGYRSYYGAQFEAERHARELETAHQKQRDLEDVLLTKDQELTRQQEQLRQRSAQLAEKEVVIGQQVTQIASLNEDIQKKAAAIQRLETSLRLHKMQRRLARVTALDVGPDPATGKPFSQIEFVELSETGDPIGTPRKFRIEGEVVYVDYLVVKFEDKYVEAADLERGMSVCLLNRIFGEFQKPNDGHTLDEPGKRPSAYARGGVLSDLEKKIWDDFWNIANQPEKANELGIRALHGDAVSIKVHKGKSYRISVRASGGPEIQAEEPPPAKAAAS